MKVITETKIRLRHRHIGCLISTKDLKVNCQRQRSDRVSNTDMKSDGFVTLFGDLDVPIENVFVLDTPSGVWRIHN